jgi:hypothetical protein
MEGSDTREMTNAIERLRMALQGIQQDMAECRKIIVRQGVLENVDPELKKIKTTLAAFEQHRYEQDIVLTGFTEDFDEQLVLESCKTIFGLGEFSAKFLTAILKPQYFTETSNINRAFKIKNTRKKKPLFLMVISLIYWTKEKMLKIVKQRKFFYLKDLGVEDPTYKEFLGRPCAGVKIYVKHRLTKENFLIERKLKKLKYDKRIDSFRFRNDLFQYRKKESSSWKIVGHVKDLDKLGN